MEAGMHIPRYRKKVGRDFAFVEHNGERTRLPGKFNSPESRDAYASFVAKLVAGKHLPPMVKPGEPLTVTTLVDAFLNHAVVYYGRGNGWHGEYANFRYVLRHLKNMFGPYAAQDIGPLRLKELQQKLAAQIVPRTKRKVSRSYVNKCTAKIKAVFKWAASEELIPIETYQALATVSGLAKGRTEARETARRLPVAWEHVEPVVAELSPTVGAMLLVQWHTGARSGSICQAKSEQFDRSGAVWLWHPIHKNQFRGQKLILPIGPKCQEVLALFIERKGYLFRPKDSRNRSTYGEHYTARSYRQAVKRAAERVNDAKREAAGDNLSDAELEALLAALIPDWTPHQVRHTKGHAVRNQYGAEAAQAVLGHETLQTTELYSEKRLGLATTVAIETG
jgi:integrase